jgi:hypothetical protein
MSITRRDLTITQKISRKFQSKKNIYSETRGHVLTPFFGKTGQKDKEKQPIETRVQSAD